MLIDDLRAFARENPTAAIICNDAADVLAGQYAKSAEQAKALSEADSRYSMAVGSRKAWQHAVGVWQARSLATEARLAEVEKERDAWRYRESETQEALQAIGDEFGVYGGEPRTDGIRRVLTEMRARLAEAERHLRAILPYMLGPGANGEADAARSFLNAQEKA